MRKEIPLYLLVGGTSGLLMVAILFLKHRRMRKEDDSLDDEHTTGTGDVRRSTVAYTGSSVAVVEIILFLFILSWFVCGNYWVFSIYSPPYFQSLRSTTPTEYCNKTVYLFSLVQILILHSVIFLSILIILFTLCCAHRLSRNAAWI